MRSPKRKSAMFEGGKLIVEVKRCIMRPVLQDIMLSTLSILETIPSKPDGVPLPPTTSYAPVVMRE